MSERQALVGLLALVAYTETWTRQTDQFQQACHALGFDYRHGDGLYDATGTRVTANESGDEIPLG